MQDKQQVELTQPALHFVMRIHVDIADALELGESHGAAKRIIRITGGSFEGPSLRGEVLEGGADWQTTRPDRVAVLYARYTLRTDSGELITVENRGFRHGKPDLPVRIAAGERVPACEYYFMTAPLFETAAPALQWLTRTIFVAQAEREKNRVTLTLWRVGDEPKVSS
jgi:hypothetical protein